MCGGDQVCEEIRCEGKIRCMRRSGVWGRSGVGEIRCVRRSGV